MLDKAVGVLHVIAESPCGLADLCDRTGLPRATAHRLAAGLEVHRLLARDADGRWCLGPALNELAGRVDDPLLAASAAVLPKLREITGEALFNEVFFDDLFVPDEMVVGPVDGGWPLARTVPLLVVVKVGAVAASLKLTGWAVSVSVEVGSGSV